MNDYTLIGVSILFWSIIGAVFFLLVPKSRTKLNIAIFFAVSILAFDIPVGRYYFPTLCEKNAGYKIYKTVKADGYVAKGEVPFGCSGGPCDLKLSNFYKQGKNLYIEGKVISGGWAGMTTGEGKYRFYLAKMDSKDCDFYKEEILKKRPTMERKYLPEGMCIASTKIEKYSTPYQYESTVSSFFLNNFIRDRSSLTNIETGEVLAESTSYRQYYGWFIQKFWPAAVFPRKSCGGGPKLPSSIVDDSFLTNMDSQ